MKIIIGNKNYSSWSLRGWLMLSRTGVEFDEELIQLDIDGFKDRILSHSTAGQVPILKHDGQTIWDSLAIGEYLAETCPQSQLWPTDRTVRARARAVSAEMHSGFAALRTHMPMDMRNNYPGEGRGEGVEADIARIIEIGSECLANAGTEGPFLFGTFTIADAMYAPVVSRFRTYGIALPDDCQAYADAVWNWPDMQAWVAAAEAEPWIIETLKT